MGCPQGIAKRGNYGSFLMDDFALVFRLINTVHPAPYTVNASRKSFNLNEHGLVHGLPALIKMIRSIVLPKTNRHPTSFGLNNSPDKNPHRSTPIHTVTPKTSILNPAPQMRNAQPSSTKSSADSPAHCWEMVGDLPTSQLLLSWADLLLPLITLRPRVA